MNDCWLLLACAHDRSPHALVQHYQLPPDGSNALTPAAAGRHRLPRERRGLPALIGRVTQPADRQHHVLDGVDRVASATFDGEVRGRDLLNRLA